MLTSLLCICQGPGLRLSSAPSCLPRDCGRLHKLSAAPCHAALKLHRALLLAVPKTGRPAHAELHLLCQGLCCTTRVQEVHAGSHTAADTCDLASTGHTCSCEALLLLRGLVPAGRGHLGRSSGGYHLREAGWHLGAWHHARWHPSLRGVVSQRALRLRPWLHVRLASTEVRQADDRPCWQSSEAQQLSKTHSLSPCSLHKQARPELPAGCCSSSTVAHLQGERRALCGRPAA